MEEIQIKSDVTIQFMVGGLVFLFPGVFHRSCSVQKLFMNSMLLQQLNNLFNFLAMYDPSISLEALHPQKARP
jgi:hypothetical protein